MGRFSYEGPSMEVMKGPAPFDCHCPEMPGQLNYWKHACLKRQRDESQKRTCYPRCHFTKRGDIDQPPPKERFLALYKEGNSIKEISEKLGVQEATVYRYRSSAMKKGLI